MHAVIASVAAVAVALVMTAPTAVAQEAPADPATAGSGDLVIIDAHIEGSGPWTSWFGGSPSRTLVLVLGNRGSTPLIAPEWEMAFGRGGDPSEALEAPVIGRLEPGESVVVNVELDLPTFAIGTYAVEGAFTGSDPPLRFRAETSHIPWVPVVLPTIALMQLGLVWVRNRVRDRIHRTPVAVARDASPVIDLREAAEPVPTSLETIICAELDRVFADAAAGHDEQLDDAALAELVVDLARSAAGRVADRADLTEQERADVDREMTRALLSTFDLAAPSRV